MKALSRFLLVGALLAASVAVSTPAQAAPPPHTAPASVVLAQPVASSTIEDSVLRLPAFAPESVTVAASRVSSKQTLVLTLIGLGIMGALRTVNPDRETYFVNDTTRQQMNKLMAWLYYSSRNRVISTTTATLPGVAIATTTTKIKTANATVLLNAGAANALAASDNFWTLTGGDLAVGYARKYLLLADAADAATVQASDDQLIANKASCAYSALPADGKAVVGSVLLENASAAAFTPGTTALTGVSGLTVTYFDAFGDDAIYPFAQVNA